MFICVFNAASVLCRMLTIECAIEEAPKADVAIPIGGMAGCLGI
jgi:hypothetical protein